LRAGARPGSTHARHRRTAGARSTERAAAVAGAGADAAAWPERAAARRTRRGTRARDPAGAAEGRRATALLLLATLVRPELARLRRLRVVAARRGRSEAWGRRAEALATAAATPATTPRAIVELAASRGRGERARRVLLWSALVPRLARCAFVTRL